MAAKLISFGDNPNRFLFHCPGCKCAHQIAAKGATAYNPPVAWDWNGSLTNPTFSPSLKVWWDEGSPAVNKVCHSFITDGKIQFLHDSTHELAGQTVEIPDWENS